ncbi:ArgS-related anticodon-binding protein NrtL [Streptomyces sp. NPDC093510]|uniref:ArgS-related anticodon-binding protein NrtL n=1 Tax=Streptomyces sp. NPDC093510 TaxID=3155199 RepID=UPI00341EF4D8
MTPVELSRTVLRAMRQAVDAGELSVDVPVDAGRVRVERPRPGGCGDYATSVALQIAGAAGRPPRQVAEVLSPRLAAQPGIAGVDITGPGFLNITLAGAREEALVREILERGHCYGHVHPDTGALAQIHVPREVRAVVVADSVRRILRSQGVLVRVTCDDAPDPAWTDVLGVRVDAHGRPPQPLPTLRPVPAAEGSRPSGTDALTSTPAPDPEPSGPLRPAGTDALTSTPAPDPEPSGPLRPAGTDTPTSTPTADPAPSGPLRLGRDAARWALLHPAAHDRPRVTPEQGGDQHLVQRESNPLFRVQYAHARTRALTRNAADLGFTATPGTTDTAPRGTVTPATTDAAPHEATAPGTTDTASRGTVTPATTDAAPHEVTAPATPATTPRGTPATTPRDTAPRDTTPRDTTPRDTVTPLLDALDEYPAVLAAAARHRAPDRLARHLVAVADAFLSFQSPPQAGVLPTSTSHGAVLPTSPPQEAVLPTSTSHGAVLPTSPPHGAVLPMGDEKPSAAHRARLALAEAAGVVLAGGLSLLGISAPDHL